MNETANIYVALGSNLPFQGRSPQETLTAALQRLAESGVRTEAISSLWTSPAWPDPSKPAYVNAVTAVKTDLDAEGLLGVLLEVENDFGRHRVLRWDSRTLDLDLIDYRGQVMETASLTLPHPRTGERAFVLLPLSEIAPDWVHPVSSEAISGLISRLPENAITQTRRIG
ncbi:MAG: 2-amino-4-hydroxy-6-hydroxymethyldihydropteridine diphosphokinase [Rhodobacterales bacterium CG15_BIG_FIL_POST_REV_8_21_14_020_59_13]|nr:MAG: 2-amino-4-hydroxy-6-hydroxymethyldihydropteridine diphosphokinase [Rhodobacterales bacterium CG15_BIG_FIL_POST_REV_8_21_14_020_59_13]